VLGRLVSEPALSELLGAIADGSDAGSAEVLRHLTPEAGSEVLAAMRLQGRQARGPLNLQATSILARGRAVAANALSGRNPLLNRRA
jgi:hypothetical protein